MRARLAEGGEPARAVLRDLFPNSILLAPDVSGRYLWAQFDTDIAPVVSPEEQFRECGFEDLDATEEQTRLLW
jgi:hypothetical protein